ncbi:MAG: hypothetical protein C4586_03575 [Anaerolineaceae bacterium]|nr:MAG: hypothetical protein C4586_03575 [Anaerolineaceae bacterium]
MKSDVAMTSDFFTRGEHPIRCTWQRRCPEPVEGKTRSSRSGGSVMWFPRMRENGQIIQQNKNKKAKSLSAIISQSKNRGE